MVKLVQVDKILPKLTREKSREFAFLGPATATLLTADGLHSVETEFKVEQPEMLLDIQARFSGESIATFNDDANQDQTITIDDKATAAALTSSDTAWTQADRLVYATFAQRVTRGTVAADSHGANSHITTQHKQWNTWAYLLEEDDIVRLNYIYSALPAAQGGVNDMNCQVNIVTAVAAPRGV